MKFKTLPSFGNMPVLDVRDYVNHITQKRKELQKRHILKPTLIIQITDVYKILNLV